MGKVVTSVPFFTDDIVIDVAETTHPEFIGRKIMLRDFAQGQMIGLSKIDNGQMECRRADGAFIVGAEAT